MFLPGQEDIESLQQLLEEHLPSVRSKHGGVARALPSTATAAVATPVAPITALSSSTTSATGSETVPATSSSGGSGPKEVNADHLRDFVILPLYAALSPEEQLRAFAIPPPGVRKIVLATNIAETSVTISGIRYVVDPGYVKTRALAGVTGVETLQTSAISQAQALQRAGRAGRESAGHCYRLYPEHVYETLAASSTPEIQRMNLAQVVLQLMSMLSSAASVASAAPSSSSAAPPSSSSSTSSSASPAGGFLSIRSIREFPFLSPPSTTGMKQALITLLRLQALDRTQQLTPLGRQMALLPLSPPYARMLLAAPALQCTAETLTAVALLSTENIFIQPSQDHDKQQASRRHRTFCLPEGDLPTLIHIYHSWVQAHKSRVWAERNYLSQRALLHAQNVRDQLVALLTKLPAETSMPPIDVTASQWPQNKNAFCQCLLMGLSANVAVKSVVADTLLTGRPGSQGAAASTPAGKVFSYSSSSPGGGSGGAKQSRGTWNSSVAPYRTLEGHQGVFVHPSSSLFATVQKGLVEKMPMYVVYAELLVTTKQYMRNLTVVSEELVAAVMTEQRVSD